MRIKNVLIVIGIVLASLSAGALVFHSPASSRPNLIVISVDTLRADHLGAYGYPRNTSPAIDAFAKQSVLFENVVSVSSWTLPSHMSLFTGLYPSTHGVTTSKKQLAPSRKLLAERLKALGYRTFAYTGGVNLSKRFGFSRGFEVYREDENPPHRKLHGFGLSVKRAKAKLNSIPKEQPYILFLHTYDVHCPYTPPEPYRSMFSTSDEKRMPANACGTGKFRRAWHLKNGNVTYLKNQYDGSIRWVDNYFGQLFSFLKARGDLKHTVIVFTSDHGEEFYEHGRIGHGGTLHRETLIIPLIIYAPGYTPRRVATQVSLIDVFPTILELLKLQPSQKAQGLSLASLMFDGTNEMLRPFQFSELDRAKTLRSLYDPSHQLIHDVNSNQDSLFNYVDDPLEHHDLSIELPEILEKKRATLLSFLDTLHSGDIREAIEPSKKELEVLKSLGYL